MTDADVSTNQPAHAIQTRRQKLAKMFGGVVDQGVWSLSNISLIIVAAKRSGLKDVGAIGFVLLLYALLIGMVRSASALPLIIRFSASDEETQREAGGAATGSAVLLGFLGSLVFLACGLLASNRMRGPMLALAVQFPLLAAQDVVRYVWLARHRPWRAAAIDLLWLVTCIIGYPIAIHLGGGASRLTSAWAAGGTIAALVGIATLRLPVFGRHSIRFLRDHWDLTRNHLGECILQYGSTVFAVALLGFVTSLDEVGRIRLGQSLLGPMRTLLLGVALAAVPEAVRTARRGVDALNRHVRWVSFGLGGLSAVFAVGLQLVPTSLGELAFGRNWETAKEVALPLSLGILALALCFGPLVGLRSLQQARVILRCSAIQVVVSAIGFIAGAFIADAMGAAIGQSIGVGVTTMVWWRAYRRAVETSPLVGIGLVGDGALAADETIVLEQFDTIVGE